MRSALLVALSLASVCDAGPNFPPVQVPPPSPSASPVRAQFLALGSAKLAPSTPCDVRFLAMAAGGAHLEDAGGSSMGTLEADDVLIAKGGEELRVWGNADAVYAVFSPAHCDSPLASSHAIVRASEAPELTWAGGTMHAHLDVEAGRSPDAYFGRISGTGAVPPHQHDGSWEVLCAYQASGTLTLADEARRVQGRECVAIPPSTKHSWKPDEGSTLTGFQMYSPPGPEQRFKALAAVQALSHGP